MRMRRTDIRRSLVLGILVLASLGLLAGCAASHRSVAVEDSSTAEEWWVIARTAQPAVQTSPSFSHPGLLARVTAIGSAPHVETIPLERLRVRGILTAGLAIITMEQVFVAASSSASEAVYRFPLPPEAAVTEFVMTIGPRRIRAIVRDAEEARTIYQQARAQGHRAALLTTDDPAAFAVKLHRLEAHLPVTVSLSYCQPVPRRNAAWQFVLPLGVYATGSRNTFSATDPYPAQVDIALEVAHPRGIMQVDSSTHELLTPVVVRPGVLRVVAGKRKPDARRDFVLSYQLRGDTNQPQAWLWRQDDDRGGFFLLGFTLAGSDRRAAEDGICQQPHIDWRGLIVREVFPAQLKELASDDYVVMVGRCAGNVEDRLRLTGQIHGAIRQFDLPLTTLEPDRNLAPQIGQAIPALWARAKIRSLLEKQNGDDEETRRACRQLARRYGVLAEGVASLVVDASDLPSATSLQPTGTGAAESP